MHIQSDTLEARSDTPEAAYLSHNVWDASEVVVFAGNGVHEAYPRACVTGIVVAVCSDTQQSSSSAVYFVYRSSWIKSPVCNRLVRLVFKETPSMFLARLSTFHAHAGAVPSALHRLLSHEEAHKLHQTITRFSSTLL